MVRLGIPRPPGVALGDRVVHGWNPDGYAALLGVKYHAARRFTPAELASRLDRVLESAQGLVARFDARQMDHVPPERKRTLRDLPFHVFRLSPGLRHAGAAADGRAGRPAAARSALVAPPLTRAAASAPADHGSRSPAPARPHGVRGRRGWTRSPTAPAGARSTPRARPGRAAPSS